MISLADIRNSVDQLLKGKFGYTVYGREVIKDFDRPSFFVELLTTGSDFDTQNFTSNKLTVIITYFQEINPYGGYIDLENVKMYESLKALFGMNLTVGTRILHPQNYRMNYMGDNVDILQVSFDLDYFDGTGRQINTEEVATTLTLNLKE